MTSADALPLHAVPVVNGSFGVIRGSTAATDRTGTVPIYYDESGCFSFDFWSLEGGGISVESAVELLSTGYVLGEHTLREGIGEVPSGAIARVADDGAVQIERYWRFDPAPQPGFDQRQATGELVELFRSLATRWGSIARFLEIDRLGLNLTAGRDSRVVALGLHDHSITYFTMNGPEVDTAGRVAAVLRGDHVVVHKWSHTHSAPDRSIVDALCPTTMVTVSNHALSLSASGPWPVDGFVSAHLGDHVAGSHLSVRARLAERGGRSKVAEMFVPRQIRFSEDLVRSVLRDDVRELANHPAATLRRLVMEADVGAAWGAMCQVDIEQRQRRFILRDFAALRTLGPSFVPFADNEWLDFWTRIPLDWMIGTPLYENAVSVAWRSIPGLSGIEVNGRRMRSTRHPRPRVVGRRVRDFVVARIAGRRDGDGDEYVAMPDLSLVETVIDPDAVLRTWEHLPRDLRWSIWTLAECAKRL